MGNGRCCLNASMISLTKWSSTPSICEQRKLVLSASGFVLLADVLICLCGCQTKDPSRDRIGASPNKTLQGPITALTGPQTPPLTERPFLTLPHMQRPRLAGGAW